MTYWSNTISILSLLDSKADLAHVRNGGKRNAGKLQGTFKNGGSGAEQDTKRNVTI